MLKNNEINLLQDEASFLTFVKHHCVKPLCSYFLYWELSSLMTVVEGTMLPKFYWALSKCQIFSFHLSSSQPPPVKLGPLKLSSSVKLIINLSTQIFLSFLVPHLFPFKIEEYQRKGGIETEQDLTRPFQVQNPFCAPCSFSKKKRGVALDS